MIGIGVFDGDRADGIALIRHQRTRLGDGQSRRVGDGRIASDQDNSSDKQGQAILPGTLGP